jgi:hypothetical protein
MSLVTSSPVEIMKKPLLIALVFSVILLCACLTGFSQTTNSFFQFVNAQSERHYTQVPHEAWPFFYDQSRGDKPIKISAVAWAALIMQSMLPMLSKITSHAFYFGGCAFSSNSKRR